MKHWIVGAGMLFCLGIGAARALDMKGLALYLPFDDGSGQVAKDASGNKNDGKFSGMVTWVAGKYGKAVLVSDDKPESMVTVKNNASFEITKQISLVAWANIEAMPDSNCSIMTKADTWMIHTSNWRGPGIEWEPLFWTPGFVAWQTTASVNVPLKEWHHVAGVWDGTQVLNYIDGEQKGSVKQAGTLAVSPVDVVIGRDSRGCCNTRKSKQTIDDVMIWNRALSAAEVKEVMKGGFLAVQPNGKATITWATLKRTN